MLNFSNYFTNGPQGTLSISPGSNFSYKGEQISVYENTEIDRWFVGSFSSASYFITVEYDSNQKETLQVLVVARPEHASYTVYGRTSIEDELITINATVTSSWMSLTASPTLGYDGARLSFVATYAETMSPLAVPTPVSSSSTGFIPVLNTGDNNFGTIQIPSQPSIIASVPTDSLNFIAGDNITLTTTPSTNTITFSANIVNYKNISVTGQTTLIPNAVNDTLTLTAGSGINLTANGVSDTITISASPNLTTVSTSSTATLNDLIVTTTATIGSNLSVTGNTTINGNLIVNGSTTTVNSTVVDIDDINITLAKGATSESANGGGITVDGALASLTWNHSLLSWQINKTLTPTLNSSINLGSPSLKWNHVYSDSLTGTLTTPTQTNITSVGALDSLLVTGQITAFGGISATDITASGLLDVTRSRETVVDVSSSAAVAYNYSLGSIFYHSTVPTVDWTINFTNIPTTDGKVITLNIIVPQGSTPYKITAASINGVSQSIKWIGSSTPTGNANKTDIWAFSLIRRGGSWVVLASQSANFG